MRKNRGRRKGQKQREEGREEQRKEEGEGGREGRRKGTVIIFNRRVLAPGVHLSPSYLGKQR
jgi:hypothetical protein